MSDKIGKKSAEAFRTISEVSGDLGVPQHVLRFWETKFSQVKPMKRGGGRRYYRPDDVALLNSIRALLYVDGYTIKGVQRLLREKGMRTFLPGEDEEPSENSALENGNDNAAVCPNIRPVLGSEVMKTSPAIKTVIDQTGIGPEKRRALEDVLNELHTIRAAIQS
ncbi:MerR family transcriptional regulator [Alphaproteobacteria bacterium]|jgi:DNA-binding transcriptional MerR regulator|nr:MerR family transcriptional regulator [Alphaproteobacteria bacterium]